MPQPDPGDSGVFHVPSAENGTPAQFTVPNAKNVPSKAAASPVAPAAAPEAPGSPKPEPSAVGRSSTHDSDDGLLLGPAPAAAEIRLPKFATIAPPARVRIDLPLQTRVDPTDGSAFPAKEAPPARPRLPKSGSTCLGLLRGIFP